MEETAVTTKTTVPEDAVTITVDATVEDPAEMKETGVEETAATSEIYATEATVTEAGTSIIGKASAAMEPLAEVAAIADMMGYWITVVLFVCFGLVHKVKREKRGFPAYLFSLWRMFWRNIIVDKPSTYLGAFKLIADGEPVEKLPTKGSEGRISLLPERRRKIMEQIRDFKHIWEKEFRARITLDNTAMRLSFYADAEGLDKLKEELKFIGDFIEAEKAVLFTGDYWDDKQHLEFFEIVFSDEGRKAKRRMDPDRARSDKEAAKWFWWGVFPVLIISLFIIHWAIWAVVLISTFFLYAREMENAKQIRELTSDEMKLSDEDIHPERQSG